MAATVDDAQAIAGLLEEMDRFYGAGAFDPIEQRVAQIRTLLAQQPRHVNVLLAKDDDRVVGLASYSFLWPAVGLTMSLFLKELYVADAYRRQGVGQQLMRQLFSIAIECGCSRVEWMTDRSNPGAQRFYEKLGFAEDATKVFYRVQGGHLGR